MVNVEHLLTDDYRCHRPVLFTVIFYPLTRATNARTLTLKAFDSDQRVRSKEAPSP